MHIKVKFEIVDTQEPGHPSLNCVIDGESYPIHSRYRPYAEAVKIAESIASSELYIVIGASLPYLAHALWLSKKPKRILCCEIAGRLNDLPAISVFSETSPAVSRVVYCGSNEELYNEIQGYYFPQFFRTVSVVVTPGYATIAKRIGLAAIEAVTSAISQNQQDFITHAHLGRVWMSNIAKNLCIVSSKKQEHLPPKDEIEVYGAGPSLESAPIEKLRIDGVPKIVADAALKWCSHHRLPVHALMSFDAQNISYIHLIGEKKLPNSLFMIDLCSHPAFARRSSRIYTMFSSHPLLSYFRNHGMDFPTVDTSGGNVGHGLVSAALDAFCARTIQCYGLDYAYIDGAPYARPGFMHTLAQYRSRRTKPAEQIFAELYIGTPHSYEERGGHQIIRNQRLEQYRKAFDKAFISQETSKNARQRTQIRFFGPGWDGETRSFVDRTQNGRFNRKDSRPLSEESILSLVRNYSKELKDLRDSFKDPLDCWESGSPQHRQVLATILPIMAWSASFILKQYPAVTDIRCEAYQLAIKLTVDTFETENWSGL